MYSSPWWEMKSVVVTVWIVPWITRLLRFVSLSRKLDLSANLWCFDPSLSTIFFAPDVYIIFEIRAHTVDIRHKTIGTAGTMFWQEERWNEWTRFLVLLHWLKKKILFISHCESNSDIEMQWHYYILYRPSMLLIPLIHLVKHLTVLISIVMYPSKSTPDPRQPQW